MFCQTWTRLRSLFSFPFVTCLYVASHDRNIVLRLMRMSQIYPELARRGWKFTALKRVTWGFATAAAAMAWAAVVQHYIYKASRQMFFIRAC